MFDNIEQINNQKENAVIASFKQIYPTIIFCYVLFVLCFKWLLFMKITLGLYILLSAVPSFLSVFPAFTLINNNNNLIKKNAILSIKLGCLGLIEIICYYYFVLRLKDVPYFRYKWYLLIGYVLLFIFVLVIDSYKYAMKNKNN